MLTLLLALPGGCASSGAGDYAPPLVEGRHVVVIRPGTSREVTAADEPLYLVDRIGLKLLLGLPVDPEN